MSTEFQHLQDVLTSACAILEFGSFVWFGYAFIEGVLEKLSVPLAEKSPPETSQEEISESQKVEIGNDLKLGQQQVENSDQRSQEITVDHPQFWVDSIERSSPLLSGTPVALEETTKNNLVTTQHQSTQAKPPGIQNAKGKTRTERLRELCRQNKIRWSAVNNGNHLTNNQMIELLKRQNVDIGDLTTSRRQSSKKISTKAA